MTEAELDELLTDCPRLFHMSAAGSWPSIRKHGLLSASALLDLHGWTGKEREAAESRLRPGSVILTEGKAGTVLLRDQKPMNETALRRCLEDGLSVAGWLRILNGRVFFWLSRERLLKLSCARTYADLEHDVLEIDSRALVERYRNRIELAAINTGSTLRMARPRGLSTFQPIRDYPYAQWRRKRRRGERAVELAVPGAVPDVGDFVLRVVRMRRDETLGTVWERSVDA